MDNQFERSEMLLGKNSTGRLSGKSVIIFGLGGVGSYLAEAIARSGIGNITLVDSDTVSVSNLNRQLCALTSTVGQSKTDVVKSRILEINPQCNVRTITKFILPKNADEFEIEKYDYIADAIDTVSAKIDLAVRSEKSGVPLISCMGTGNKLDPTLFEVSDIYKTSVCPLCRVMRTELKKRNVRHLEVVWSPEQPIKTSCGETGKPVPGSVSFVPGVAGLIMAGVIIKNLSAED